MLFLFFVLIPPAGKKGSLALIALGLCTYFICGLSAAAILPGCVRSLLQNLIWFAMGLALANAPADLLRKKPLPLLLGTGFLLLAGITFTLLHGNRALGCSADCWPAERCYPLRNCGTRTLSYAGR